MIIPHALNPDAFTQPRVAKARNWQKRHRGVAIENLGQGKPKFCRCICAMASRPSLCLMPTLRHSPAENPFAISIDFTKGCLKVSDSAPWLDDDINSLAKNPFTVFILGKGMFDKREIRLTQLHTLIKRTNKYLHNMISHTPCHQIAGMSGYCKEFDCACQLIMTTNAIETQLTLIS